MHLRRWYSSGLVAQSAVKLRLVPWIIDLAALLVEPCIPRLEWAVKHAVFNDCLLSFHVRSILLMLKLIFLITSVNRVGPAGLLGFLNAHQALGVNIRGMLHLTLLEKF
jgi:hypothetical protein